MPLLRYLRTPVLSGSDIAEKRCEIANYYNATSSRYESLFEVLATEDGFYQKPNSLRHPLIFYYGHTATFFINKLILSGLISQRINPKLESLFAVGVDEMSWDDLNDTHYEWPTVEEVKDYRNQVNVLLNDLINNAPLALPIDWQNPWWTILMGIEHEQIHLETSSVLIRQQALERVQQRDNWQAWTETSPAPVNTLVNIPEGVVEYGKQFDDVTYGWDNEYGHHSATTTEFKTSRYLVSNQEFLAFVDAGGYLQDYFWETEGLEWRNSTGTKHPLFWLKSGDDWRLRLLTEEVKMPWSWPAEVNYHEAKAFCNWKAEQTGQLVRLPTEDEWYQIYNFAAVTELKNGQQAEANIHLDHAASPCPVNQFSHGDLFDVVGNVWQWTETAIYPFDGFQVHPYYDDFTMPTFDGKHHIIKGGSWISSGNESRKEARYAFRKHFFQHAGFRYVVAEPLSDNNSSNYETDKMLSEYAEFHYGDNYFEVENFPKTLARMAIEAMGDKATNKALDIGCAAGRASFELAQQFDEVTAIDFSARLINLGVRLVEQGNIRYSIVDEGGLAFYREHSLAEHGLENVSHKVEFWQGDACNLKPSFRAYDLVLAANLIDRLYQPRLFLTDISKRINIGGLLLIASPYTWLDEHTKKEDWVGGFKKDGENYTTLDGLKAVLADHFKLIKGPVEVPFVIRETSRKFQHTLSEVTIWERKL